MIILIVIYSILSILISILIYRRINYFKNLNVPHETLNILFGNTQKSTLGKCSIAYDADRVYTWVINFNWILKKKKFNLKFNLIQLIVIRRKFKGSGLFAGFMNGFTPFLLPLNAEVLKQVLITNFKNFRNNSFGVSIWNHDPIIWML